MWIDENGTIVRPAEPAWPKPRKPGRIDLPEGTPQRLVDIMDEAANIVAWTADDYGNAVRDWAANGADSSFVMAADEVLARSGARDSFTSTAAAHFALAEHFERSADHDKAVEHFRQAHRLAPGNWTYKRQAWSIEGDLDGPMARFWQGPAEGDDGADWPYESDWLTEIRNRGARHYYRETHL
ncbi:MAG: tetratricopeptide repeat protein [Acidimicrobiia bacterium]|nr:tetratricopeptide repeat protein [Acidimicrobiia bacterium]